MIKILVDYIPVEAEDRPFSDFIQMTNKHQCILSPSSSLYSRCKLECGEMCDKLKEANKGELNEN